MPHPPIAVLRVPATGRPPRDALRADAIAHGNAAPPLMPMAGTATERWMALCLDPAAEVLGALDTRWLADPAVQWVGGHGTKVLVRGGSPMVATVARVRTRTSAWCAVWPRAPGGDVDADLGIEWDDTQGALPTWLRPLFPPLVDAPITLVDAVATPTPVVPPPSEILPVPGESTHGDVTRVAGTRMEARLVAHGRREGAAVAWFPGEVRFWWERPDRELADIGRAVGQDLASLAVGYFGNGPDEAAKCRRFVLALESRSGPTLAWVHRYQEVGAVEGRWVGPATLEPHPPLGWIEPLFNLLGR